MVLSCSKSGLPDIKIHHKTQDNYTNTEDALCTDKDLWDILLGESKVQSSMYVWKKKTLKKFFFIYLYMHKETLEVYTCCYILG